MTTTVLTSCLLAAGIFFDGSRPIEHARPVAQKASQCPNHAKVVQVVYPVADLVVPVSQAVCARGEESKKTLPITLETPTAQKPASINEARLMELIRTTIAPRSWAARGGRGTMEYYTLGMSLVVTQSPAVQEQIADLLAALRRAHDMEVALEIRVLSAAEGFFERNQPLVNGEQADPCLEVSYPTGTAALERLGQPLIIDYRQVLDLLERAQGDVRTSVVQAPRLVVLNGQEAHVDTTRKEYFVTATEVKCEGGEVFLHPRNEPFEMGLRFALRPVVAADRRSVRLSFQASLTELAARPLPNVSVDVRVPARGGEKSARVRQILQRPLFQTMKVDKAFQVPDGKTAVLLWGQTIHESRPATSGWSGILSAVPLLDQFCSDLGPTREVRTVLVLVTPRIVINEEKEPVLLGQVPPLPRP